MLDLLRACWEKRPFYRLGQLIHVLGTGLRYPTRADSFYTSDEEVEQEMLKFLEEGDEV